MTSREKLSTYRGKRDFAKTPEPSGARKKAGGANERRFVVQRHRARNLHYDVRLEVDGVLVSWAVPKGPTLSAGVRRGAYHVEDHPMEYIDFEGVIPAGEYGGGDVIVWDIGTWEPQEQDPAKALADGELHADLHGEKLNGRFVFVRTRADDWILLHKKDAYAKPNWDPEKHPRSVLSGRTNDEVKADPDRLWRSDLPAATASLALKADAATEADRDELKALDRLKTQGTWHVFGRDLKVTNLDKVLFPGRGRQKPITKRDFLRYTAQIAPTILPYLTRRPLNLHRYPDGAGTRGFWQKELPKHAPEWIGRWDNPDAAAGDSQTYLVADEPAALLWAANFGALEWHAWTSQVDKPDKPTYALIDLDPGTDTTWADLVTLAKLHHDALDHLGVAVPGQADRQARHPDLDPDHPRPVVRDHPRLGREAVPFGRGGGAGAGQLEVAEVAARRPGPARLHPERHRQHAGRALQPAARGRCAGVGADPLGRARRPEAQAGRVHHEDDPRTPRDRGRPVPRRGGGPAEAAPHLVMEIFARPAEFAGDY